MNNINNIMYIGYDYVVRSYSGDKLMMETVHKGVHTKDMELLAIKDCHRRAEVFEVSPQGDLREVSNELPSWAKEI